MGYTYAKRTFYSKVSFFICVSLLVTAILPFMARACVAFPETRVYVNPSETQVSIGKTFVIYVNIADVVDLYGYNIWLSYNTTILNVISVGPPHMLPEPMINVIEPDGIIHISKILLPPAMPVSGSGTVASITFNATAAGSCVLDLFNITLFDPDLNPIPHSSMDGSVTIKAYISNPVCGIAHLVAILMWY